MTEGHDDVDDQPTEQGSAESRDQKDEVDNGWDQPGPSEVEGGEQSASGRTDAEARAASDRGQQDRRPSPDQGPGHAGSPPQSSDGVAPRTQGHPDPGKSVEITDRARDDDTWIDLSEHTLGGEALGAADLSEEKLSEYTTDRRSLHSLVQVHWGIRVAIGALIAGLVATWGLGTLGVNQQFGGALVGLFLVLGLVWVVLYYRLWFYEVRADAIYLERGVVTHVRSLVPYVRIQHVDTSQSPIERMLGLSTLVVYTAGSRGADVSIPGLQPGEARDLQRRVKELAIEAEGDDAL